MTLICAAWNSIFQNEVITAGNARFIISFIFHESWAKYGIHVRRKMVMTRHMPILFIFKNRWALCCRFRFFVFCFFCSLWCSHCSHSQLVLLLLLLEFWLRVNVTVEKIFRRNRNHISQRFFENETSFILINSSIYNINSMARINSMVSVDKHIFQNRLDDKVTHYYYILSVVVFVRKFHAKNKL